MVGIFSHQGLDGDEHRRDALGWAPGRASPCTANTAEGQEEGDAENGQGTLTAAASPSLVTRQKFLSLLILGKFPASVLLSFTRTVKGLYPSIN